MYSHRTNPNYVYKNFSNYGTQRSLEEGGHAMLTNSTKFTPRDELYEKSVNRNFSKFFENQFYKTIKTPEDTKLIQPSVGNNGR